MPRVGVFDSKNNFLYSAEVIKKNNNGDYVVLKKLQIPKKKTEECFEIEVVPQNKVREFVEYKLGDKIRFRQSSQTHIGRIIESFQGRYLTVKKADGEIINHVSCWSVISKV